MPESILQAINNKPVKFRKNTSYRKPETQKTSIWNSKNLIFRISNHQTKQEKAMKTVSCTISANNLEIK